MISAFSLIMINKMNKKFLQNKIEKIKILLIVIKIIIWIQIIIYMQIGVFLIINDGESSLNSQKLNERALNIYFSLILIRFIMENDIKFEKKKLKIESLF